MKGVILGGGEGTRLRPFTYAYNKSFAPVYNKPLIYYPLFTLKRAGIRDIILICSPEHRASYQDLLGEGEHFGLNIVYGEQDAPLGIAHALGQAEDYAKGEKIMVILGDEVIEDDLSQAVKDFKNQEFKTNQGKQTGAKIGLKQVDDPRRFGVVEFEQDRIKNIQEKPENPKSNWVFMGMGMYDERVFDLIKKLEPSDRGEYEITDLHNLYIEEKTMSYHKLKGEWFDAGTFDSLLAASNFVANHPVLKKPDLLEGER